MNRNRTGWMAGLLSTAFLAGCGSGTEDSPGASDPTPPPNSATEEPMPETEPPTDGPADDETDAGSAPEPDRKVASDEPHEWPPVALDAEGDSHVVVVECPDPGWTAQLDGVETLPAGRRAFVTLLRPPLGQMFPQVITERRIDTGVPLVEPLEVVVRLRTPGDTGTPPPYRPASRP